MAAELVWTDTAIEDAFQRICDLISCSELGVDHICASDDTLPSARTFYKWVREDESKRQRYAHAREAQQHFCIDNGVALSTQLVARNPAYQIDPAAFRAYFDAIKFRASKLHPKVYGDKAEINHTGGTTITVQLADYSKPKEIE
jgi:hypothetical protein